jgi:imidazole glycerol-phosphate synthase subunit HisH
MSEAPLGGRAAGRVAVIDYGMGNIGSICNMLRYVGVEPLVSSDPDQLRVADRLILPGVGHFDRAMTNLNETGLAQAICELVLDRRVAILGICLGMQLMCKASDEGTQPGLGFIDAHVQRFQFPKDRRYKVPHMGWAQLEHERESPLLAGLNGDARFYFVHSYFVKCDDPADVMARSRYGHTFVSAFERDRVRGVQFHPEKSHRFGMQLLRNFVGTQ